MSDKQSIEALVDSTIQPNNEELQAIGAKVGKLYTDHGLPLDMSLARLHHTKVQKIAILSGACSWFIEHKRLSGATEKAIERQRRANRQMLEGFIASGETGVY